MLAHKKLTPNYALRGSIQHIQKQEEQRLAKEQEELRKQKEEEQRLTKEQEELRKQKEEEQRLAKEQEELGKQKQEEQRLAREQEELWKQGDSNQKEHAQPMPGVSSAAGMQTGVSVDAYTGGDRAQTRTQDQDSVRTTGGVQPPDIAVMPTAQDNSNGIAGDAHVQRALSSRYVDYALWTVLIVAVIGLAGLVPVIVLAATGKL